MNNTLPTDTTQSVATLLMTDLVDSTKLYDEVGDTRASAYFARHDELTRDLLATHDGLEIDRTDGFLMLFNRPLQALRFGLQYHDLVRSLSGETSLHLGARVGIHLGEVLLHRNETDEMVRGATQFQALGIAVPLVARLTSLATGGQTLLSYTAFELARSGSVGDPLHSSELEWLAHGEYRFQGIEDSMRVFEVGVRGVAPLCAPAGSSKAHRVENDSRSMSGWRPAPGEQVPFRAGWRIVKQLGQGGFGEAWLISNDRSGDQRVLKFCFDPTRLDNLKREVALFRLLRDKLGNRDDIARVLDWNLDASPHFLESEFICGGNLAEWLEQCGGTMCISLKTRLHVLARACVAIQAAHDAGILHKDIKPGNILISGDKVRPRVVLTDFGVATLHKAPELTTQSHTGMSDLLDESSRGSRSGTQMYMAPEIIDGAPATIQSDIYSIGVILYQLVIGDLSRSLSHEWELDVHQWRLRRLIRRFARRNPADRIQSAQSAAVALRRCARGLRTGRLRTAVLALIVLCAVAALLMYRRNPGPKSVRELHLKKLIEAASPIPGKPHADSDGTTYTESATGYQFFVKQVHPDPN